MKEGEKVATNEQSAEKSRELIERVEEIDKSIRAIKAGVAIGLGNNHDVPANLRDLSEMQRILGEFRERLKNAS